jgi:hypothetical protein
MPIFLGSDMQQLKALRDFLATSFRGASVGQLKIDDAVKSLERAIVTLEPMTRDVNF